MRSPLGLPLGDRGLLPLPDALPGVGAGVVAGGPYTIPQRMLDTDTGASSRTGTGTVTSATGRRTDIHFLLYSTHLSHFPNHRPQGHERTGAAWPRTAITSGATLLFRHRSGRLIEAVLAGRGVVFEAPRACLGHRPSRRCGAALLSQPITKEEKTRREGASRPEGSCMRLAPLQAVAQNTGMKNWNN